MVGLRRSQQGNQMIAGILGPLATLSQAPSDRRNEADVTTTVAPSAPLTAADRCDRCGAQAYLRVELQSGGELLFCAHHARKHAEVLRSMAVEWVDETDRLTEDSSTR